MCLELDRAGLKVELGVAVVWARIELSGVRLWSDALGDVPELPDSMEGGIISVRKLGGGAIRCG